MQTVCIHICLNRVVDSEIKKRRSPLCIALPRTWPKRGQNEFT